jgi:hypothetical protein
METTRVKVKNITYMHLEVIQINAPHKNGPRGLHYSYLAAGKTLCEQELLIKDQHTLFQGYSDLSSQL